MPRPRLLRAPRARSVFQDQFGRFAAAREGCRALSARRTPHLRSGTYVLRPTSCIPSPARKRRSSSPDLSTRAHAFRIRDQNARKDCAHLPARNARCEIRSNFLNKFVCFFFLRGVRENLMCVIERFVKRIYKTFFSKEEEEQKRKEIYRKLVVSQSINRAYPEWNSSQTT